MRKIALTAMFIAAAMTATAQQLSYAVSGKYAGNGQKIYLIDKLTDKAIDSVTVADSKFSFNGNATKDALMGVKAKDSAWTTLFFNDGTPVAVNVNVQQHRYIRLTPSPTTSLSTHREKSLTAHSGGRHCTTACRKFSENNF